jgi:hypothetical protein
MSSEPTSQEGEGTHPGMKGPEHLEEQRDKHSRFNLRKLNLPPIQKDHSRVPETQRAM